MSNFFNNFQTVDYAFGDDFIKKGGGDLYLELFQDISSYVDVVDEIKNQAPFYAKYYVLENDRPDQVSQKIYGTTDYHWTFFIMNDHIRRQGWPLSMQELDKKVKRDFPHKYIQTKYDLTGVLIPGQRAVGAISGATGLVLKRNLDIGVVVIDSDDQFQAAENVSNTSYTGITKAVTVDNAGFEYNSPHHYEDGDGNPVDIDPAVGPGALVNEVTHYDEYIRQNDKLKEINVIRPDAIQNVVGAYFEALKS